MLDRQVASPVGRQGMSAGDQRTCQLTEASPTSGPIPCHSLSPRPHPPCRQAHGRPHGVAFHEGIAADCTAILARVRARHVRLHRQAQRGRPG